MNWESQEHCQGWTSQGLSQDNQSSDKVFAQGPFFNANQDYVIVSKSNPSMAVNVQRNSQNNYQLILLKKECKSNQRFKFPFENGKYMIISQDYQQVVEVPGNSNQNGIKIQAGKMKDMIGQQWEFVPVHEQQNTFFIKSFCGKCLDAGNSTQAGTNLIQSDYNGSENQIWVIKPEDAPKRFDPHKNYIIASAVNENLVFDISQDPSMKRIILRGKHRKRCQLWKIQNAREIGKFILHSGAGGVLRVCDSLTGSNAELGNYGQSKGEFWEILPVKNHKSLFYIRSFCGMALDISQGRTQPNTPIIQNQFQGGEKQMWNIEQL